MTPLFVAVSLSVSLVSLDGDTGPRRTGFGGSLRVPLGSSTFLEPEIGFWEGPPRDTGYAQARTRDASLSFIITSRPAPVRLFLGMGGGAHDLEARSRYADFRWRGVHVHTLAGIEWTWGPVTVFGALRGEVSFPLGSSWAKTSAGVRIKPRWAKR